MNQNMKKTIALLGLLCCAVLLMTGCASNADSTTSSVSTSDQMPVVLNTSEYVLYQNIFYNDYGKNYVGKTVSKTGVFTTLVDAWNNTTRYYVWGYNDNTKCCDWQWEIIPADMNNLPANGSLVTAKGTFTASDNALDGYWITNAAIQVHTAYTGPTAEVDMAMMSDTLERVQVANIVRWAEQFEGKTYSAYGSIAALDTLQDPYYTNSWTIGYTTSETAPAVGSESLLRGTITGGVLADATFSTRAE